MFLPTERGNKYILTMMDYSKGIQKQFLWRTFKLRR